MRYAPRRDALLCSLLIATAGFAAETYDLVVYGGTAGGVITAVSGAREGLQDHVDYVQGIFYFLANDPLIEDLEELYDLEADPEELNNLAVKPEHQETLERFRAAAIEELRRTKAGFVDDMPPVRKASL